MNTNWNHYRIFYHVYKSGTTSAAANELHIAQPAVSHDIKQLENTLGCKLFKRSSYGMSPTDIGRLLFENISGAVEAIEGTEMMLEAELSSSDKVVNIGISDISLQLFFFPFLDSYSKTHPDIETNVLHCKNLDELMLLFAEKKIDFAVFHDAPVDNEYFCCTPVKTVQDVVFCSAKSAQRIKKEVLSPADLAQYPVVTHEKGCVIRRNVDEYILSQGLEPLNPSYEFSLNSSVLHQVNRSYALGFIIDEVIAEDVSLGKFVTLPLIPPLPQRHIWLIRPAKMHRKYAKKMAEYVLNDLKKV